MIDMQGKHKIHISCCAGLISKQKDIFVVSLSLLDTETTIWITALPGYLHPWYWLWRIKKVLVFDEKSINSKDARGHSSTISSNGIGLGVLTWNILISTHRGSLPHQAISTRDIDYSQYHGCWWPGNASKVSHTRNYLSYIRYRQKIWNIFYFSDFLHFCGVCRVFLYLHISTFLNGAHPARLNHDVSEEAAGWAHQIDIQSDLERKRF